MRSCASLARVLALFAWTTRVETATGSGSRPPRLPSSPVVYRKLGQPLLRQLLGGAQEPHLSGREVDDGRGFAATRFALDGEIHCFRNPRVHLFETPWSRLAREVRARGVERSPVSGEHLPHRRIRRHAQTDGAAAGPIEDERQRSGPEQSGELAGEKWGMIRERKSLFGRTAEQGDGLVGVATLYLAYPVEPPLRSNEPDDGLRRDENYLAGPQGFGGLIWRSDLQTAPQRRSTARVVPARSERVPRGAKPDCRPRSPTASA